MTRLGPGFDLSPGMAVGLYGGSFNPAHGGHAHVARTALRRLGLDRVIWLVSPQNPLKPSGETRPLAERLASARARAGGPRMAVSDVETRLGVVYSIDLVEALKAQFPDVRFVWIMGSDAFADLHRWKRWRDLARTVPIAVVARPGGLRAGLSPAARMFAGARLAEGAARTLAGRPAPAWTILSAPLNPESSTALRRAGG